MRSVGVVIVNWNNAKDTIVSIGSLTKIKSCKLRILVIDNGSNGEDVELLRNLDHVILIINSANVGYARAVNQGIGYFQEHHPNIDYLLLLNNDAYCKDDFLMNLIQEFDSNSELASISPSIYSVDKMPSLLDSGGVLDKKAGLVSNNYLDHNNMTTEKGAYLVDWVSGCANLLKFEAVNSTGYLEEVYEMYVEDVDYSIRLRKNGYTLMYHSNSRIYHGLSKSSGGNFSYLKRFFIARNMILLSKKYFSASFLLLTACNQVIQCKNYPAQQMPYAIWTTFKGLFCGLAMSSQH